jgi:hypothetical protein
MWLVATLGFALAAGVYGNGIDQGEVRLLAARTGGSGAACSDGEHEVPFDGRFPVRRMRT